LCLKKIRVLEESKVSSLARRATNLRDPHTFQLGSDLSVKVPKSTNSC